MLCSLLRYALFSSASSSVLSCVMLCSLLRHALFSPASCSVLSCVMLCSLLRHALFSPASCSVLSCVKLCSLLRHALFSRASCSVLSCVMLCSLLRHALFSPASCSVLSCVLFGLLFCSSPKKIFILKLFFNISKTFRRLDEESPILRTGINSSTIIAFLFNYFIKGFDRQNSSNSWEPLLHGCTLCVVSFCSTRVLDTDNFIFDTGCVMVQKVDVIYVL